MSDTLAGRLANHIFDEEPGITARIVIACRRCGKKSSSARWKRWRCLKCRAAVDHEKTVFKFEMFREDHGQRVRITEQELEEGIRAAAFRHGAVEGERCSVCAGSERGTE